MREAMSTKFQPNRWSQFCAISLEMTDIAQLGQGGSNLDIVLRTAIHIAQSNASSVGADITLERLCRPVAQCNLQLRPIHNKSPTSDRYPLILDAMAHNAALDGPVLSRHARLSKDTD
eukprot:SAG11_NODE_2978_length_2795_cov_4.170623_4_plen_117_part_01